MLFNFSYLVNAQSGESRWIIGGVLTKICHFWLTEILGNLGLTISSRLARFNYTIFTHHCVQSFKRSLNVNYDYCVILWAIIHSY